MPPSPAPDTCWLYLFRHGATANNRARPPRLQGRRSDPALSDEGRRQARQTGALLARVPLANVYSSPLLRARQTAHQIALPRHLSVEVVDDLIEVDVGDWEGRAWDEIERTDTDAYRRFMADASLHPYLGGENLSVVQSRVIPAFERLMAQHLGQTIAAVAHNVVNRAYLTHLLGIPLAQYRSVPQDNCGLNLIRHRNGKPKLVTVNAITHLDEQP
ncbi:MAG: hypothetical protein A2V70_10280 [Planctomycetes bacterium RBG_13_63_9]|nr:MAG: hypothetical protein A2V70_10280 [Planctomycetes bacterium RBG_13_63_9]